MADAAMRIEEALAGATEGKDLTGELISQAQRIGKAFGSLLKSSKAMARRMEGYRYEVASRVPFHCSHI